MREYDCTVNTPALDKEEKKPSIKTAVQETRKILYELSTVLEEISSNVIGEHPDQDKPFEPDCLLTESKMVTGLSYDLLMKAKDIRDALL